jgi:hypothetical protein
LSGIIWMKSSGCESSLLLSVSPSKRILSKAYHINIHRCNLKDRLQSTPPLQNRAKSSHRWCHAALLPCILERTRTNSWEKELHLLDTRAPLESIHQQLMSATRWKP